MKILLHEWSKISRLWIGRFIVHAYQIGKLQEGLFVSQAWPGFVLTFPASWVQFSSTQLVHVVCSHLIIAGSLFRCGSQSFTSQVRVYLSFEARSVYECQCVHTFTITVCQLYAFGRTDCDFSLQFFISYFYFRINYEAFKVKDDLEKAIFFWAYGFLILNLVWIYEL